MHKGNEMIDVNITLASIEYYDVIFVLSLRRG